MPKTKKHYKKRRTIKKRKSLRGAGFTESLRKKTQRYRSPEKNRIRTVNPNDRDRARIGFDRTGRKYVIPSQQVQTYAPVDEWKQHTYAVSNKYGPSQSSFYAGPALENPYLYETQGIQPIPHGKDGTIVYSTGNIYKGDFNQGKREGFGTLQIKEGKTMGPKYEGEWKEDKFVPFMEWKESKK
jgi:hypothetical protein